MLHRRDFFKTATLMGVGSVVPTFLARAALATPNSAQTGAKDTVLVVVQLTGGNDGLNTVIPFKDAAYAKLRPTIKIPADRVKKLDDSLGLHPSMSGFSGLHDDGKLCVVQGVGYPNPSQSHFRSMDIWNAGSLAEKLTEGWIGKALKTMNAPAFHVSGNNEMSPLALAGAPVRAPSIASLADFRLKMMNGPNREGQKHTIQEATKSPTKNNLLDFVQKTALNTYMSSDRLQAIGQNYEPKVPYPASPLGEKLKLCAQLIEAGLGARIFYVSIDGFDTHADQGGANGSHANLLQQVSDAIAAFYKDLAERGHGERLTVMTFSEFGRRADENGSKGTDHGSGAPMFLVGGKVKPGLVGKHPSLTDLEEGNLKHAIDFRQVYATLLDEWLGVSSKEVLGKAFKTIECLKS